MQIEYISDMKKITINLISLLFLFLTLNAEALAQNVQLIDWFAGADIVGVANSSEEVASDFNVREFEISAYSQIDYIWQGNLTMALHRHTGEQHTDTEIHEAFLFSNQLISNTSFKLGRFFLGFGRLNRFHRHDWSISEAPQYHNQFFGFEAVRDDGVEVSKLLSKSFYLQLTAGLTSGKEFKEEHQGHQSDEVASEEFKTPHVPTHYFRLSTFKEFTTQKGLEYALSYVGRTDAEGSRYQYYGIDLVYKNKVARFYKDLFQIEAWQRNSYIGQDELTDIGAYMYYENGFNQNHALGIKLDWYQSHESHDGHDEATESSSEHHLEIANHFSELGIVYSYYNSEFMRTRLTLSHTKGLLIEEKQSENTKLMLQTVFTIGAHPAHLY